MKMLFFDMRDSEKEFFKKEPVKDYDITFFEACLDSNTALSEEQLRETDVISAYKTSRLSSDVLSKFANLRYIASRSEDFSYIDLDYCIKRKIAVFFTDRYGEDAAAQFTIALILCLVRNIIPAINDVKNGNVHYLNYEGKTLSSLTLGVVGCGTVGAKVVEIAHFLGMKVLVCSYMQNPAVANKCNFVSFDELIGKSDVISLHVLSTEENLGMLDNKAFERMKNGVYIINISGLKLIDMNALYKYLSDGKVKGAAFDVYDSEYMYNTGKNTEDIETLTKLMDLKNVIITPQISTNTKESVDLVLETIFNSLKDSSKGLYTNRVC